jgi:hypothetical protein
MKEAEREPSILNFHRRDFPSEVVQGIKRMD